MKRNRITLGVAVVAAVFAGSAIGANQWIITSGSQIKNNVIPASKLTPAARQSLHGLNGTDGASGAKGDQGNTGIQGAKGDTGATGPAGKGTTFTYVSGAVVEVAPESNGFATAQCPAGAFAVGGTFGAPDGYLYMEFSSQDVDASGNPTGAWDVEAFNPDKTQTKRLHTWAVCAS